MLEAQEIYQIIGYAFALLLLIAIIGPLIHRSDW